MTPMQPFMDLHVLSQKTKTKQVIGNTHFYLLNCVDEHTGGFIRRPRVQHRPHDLIYAMIFIKCGSAILNDSNN